MFLNAFGNTFTLRVRNESTFQLGLVPVQPAELWIFWTYHAGDRTSFFAASLYSNNITGFKLKRRDVHHLTIHLDVFVAYQLTGCRARRRDTHAVDCVVKTSFKKFDQVFTGNTFDT